MTNYSSQPNQTVYDICLQTYGDLNMLYKLIQDSNFSNILTQPLPGTMFTFNPKLVADNTFGNYLASNKLTITTGQPNPPVIDAGALETDDGIGLETDSGQQINVD